MYRCLLPVLLAGIFACGSAVAGPLALHPDSYSQETTAGPTYQREAAANNFGGGFIELLFGGPARWQSQPSYQGRQGGYDSPALPAYGQPYEPQGSGRDYYPGAQNYQMNPRFLRQEVRYDGTEAPGTIIINTSERLLYLVEGGGRALRYGIGVGRPGFSWAGVHAVTNKREWPDWTPPDEMLRRRPDLPRHMAGGPENPLGARAMYLGSTLYRIHGSNEPWTIGTAVSSGCIRMRNEDVIDLYDRVRIGTKVVVI
jgi:lipoprotein-anchoring transpeptidase ErfK/SrfK